MAHDTELIISLLFSEEDQTRSLLHAGSVLVDPQS